MSVKQAIALVFGVLALIVGAVSALGSFYTVQSGEVGIIKTWGQVTDITGEGLNFKIPFAQSVEKYDIRTRKGDAPAQASSKDLQSVSTTVSLNYRIDKQNLMGVYKSIGLDVESKIIDPRVQEVVKSVTSKYTATQLVSLREQVRSEIESALRASVTKFGITLEGVQITNFNFSSQFVAAVEAKIQAEQVALKSKMDLERIKIEAEQQIVTAKADAEKIRIQAEAIRANGGQEYVKLQALSKWNGELPSTVYISGGGKNEVFQIPLK